MKNKLFIFTFLVSIFSFLISVHSPTLAGNDLIITCDSNSCTKSSNLSFFDEKNIVPGFSKTQTITVYNERPDSCNLLFKIKPSSLSNSLSAVQMLSIFTGDTLWQAGSFNDLANNKNHSLGNIDSYQSKEYSWTASLNQSLDNNIQLLNNSYDLDLNFTCGNEEDSDNSCHAFSPLNRPKNLKATPGQNSVTLSWEETADVFSYYLISYSTEAHAATFANANIGGRGTTSFTINNLLADVTYYFKIRTGNLCAPGQFSDIVSATPSGKIITNSLAPNPFQPKVLGTQNSIPTNLGNQSKISCLKIFPFAFLLALILNFILIKSYLFPSFLISLSALLFDYYLSNNLCLKFDYFYINNLLSFLIPLLFSLKKRKS
ncbi:MAG TPA: fibronectin type III domain-containing protein [Candidatus Woesebacteria bacterium]|nr:fibronectin type III domain-containing protein [Candidatus Woesebacteria bacterium]